MPVFLEFQLPSPATWFYWSLMLAMALFFQFSKPLALRNFDLLALYLFVPGVLLVQFGGEPTTGYPLLLAASGFWFVRALFDSVLSQRPHYRANLNKPGLAFFGIALFAVLIGVAIRKPMVAEEMIGKSPATITVVKEGATVVVNKTQPTETDAARVVAERSLALFCHGAVAAGLLVIGLRHFRDLEIGAAMSTLYLLAPYTGYHVAQLHHVLPAALVIWALVVYRAPARSGFLLGLAAGATFFPVLLFPVWLRLYWRHSPWKFIAAYLGALALGVGVTLLVLWSVGLFPGGMTKALYLSDWQPWRRPSAEGFWQGVHWAYRLPMFILYAGFILSLFFWPSVRTLAQVTSLSAAVLIGIQFWYAERGGMYVLWYLPLLIVMTLRPTTAELDVPVTANGGWWNAVWRFRRRADESNPPVLAG